MASLKESKIVKEDIQRIAEEIREIARTLEGKTLLIAGGAGFLGKYLVLTLDYLNEHVLEKPCKVLVLDNFIVGLRDALQSMKHITVIQHDISKPFKTHESIDYVIHAASIASPIFYNKLRIETIDAGVLGTKNLLELAKEKKVKSFLFFSSSEVYGNPDPKFIPTPESYFGNVSCIGPRACYDEPKRMGETLCITYADIFNLPIKIVRPFNIFGPGMRLDDGRVVPNFVVSALKGERIPLYGSGSNTRTFCYISDAIVGFFQVLLSSHNREVFNIGSDDQEIQVRHFADLVAGLMENDSSIQNVEGPNEAYTLADPNRRCPDLTKIRTMIGYKPKINSVTGLKRFIAWVREELATQEAAYPYERHCRTCGNGNLKKILSFGKTPLANNLLSVNELDKPEEVYPLEVLYCNQCSLCQLSYVVPPEKMFQHYLYVTSTTETFKKHFQEMAESLTKELKLKPSSLVVDIGSNDGLLLKRFQGLGMRAVGVEPAENIVHIAREQGVDTVHDFFHERVVEDIIRLKGKADLVTANNVFAHVADIKTFSQNVKKLLNDKGVFVIEVQYLLDTLKNLTFDNIYHEHLSYFSLLSLHEFFKRQEMEIFRAEHVASHGGSLRVFVQKMRGVFPVDASVQDTLNEERQFGLEKGETYERFAEKVYNIRNKLQEFFRKAQEEGKIIAGYGAPAKATTLLAFCGITHKHMSYVVEDNPLKQGMIIPSARIPIVSGEMLEKQPPKYLMVLAWNFADEILKKNEKYREKGVQFVVPLPQPKIIS